MKASEILHGIAELLAGLEGQQVQQSPNQAALVQVTTDNTDNTDTSSGTFVPPLQAKLELLKKSVGVDNVYDEGGPDEQMTGQGDDLNRMKQLSGINVVAQQAAADDEPFDC
jgi:hypothetical protein